MIRNKRGRRKTTSFSFFKRYSVEINAFLFFIIGIFLLYEEYNIKTNISSFFQTIINFLKTLSYSILDYIIYKIVNIEISDIFGIILILFSFLLIYKKLKYNFIKKHNLTEKICQNCNVKLNRIRKLKYHILMEIIFFIKIKNYICNICKNKIYTTSRSRLK